MKRDNIRFLNDCWKYIKFDPTADGEHDRVSHPSTSLSRVQGLLSAAVSQTVFILQACMCMHLPGRDGSVIHEELILV